MFSFLCLGLLKCSIKRRDILTISSVQTIWIWIKEGMIYKSRDSNPSTKYKGIWMFGLSKWLYKMIVHTSGCKLWYVFLLHQETATMAGSNMKLVRHLLHQMGLTNAFVEITTWSCVHSSHIICRVCVALVIKVYSKRNKVYLTSSMDWNPYCNLSAFWTFTAYIYFYMQF